MNLYNALIILTSLTPVWTLALKWVRIRGKRWFILLEATLICAGLWFLTSFHNWRWNMSNVVWFLYIIEIALALLLFTRKLGYDKLNVSLACSLLMVYVLSEFHEWVGFVFADYLHFFVDPYTLLAGRVPTLTRIFSNLYVLVAFIMLIKSAKIKVDNGVIILFLLTFLISPLFLVLPGPHWVHIIKRGLLFAAWAIIFYKYAGTKKDASLVGS